MTDRVFAELRQDCLRSCAEQADVRAGLARQHIAVTGGTGFLGSWIAETVAALNDEFGLGIVLELLARDIRDWPQQRPHLASRLDIRLRSQDVRSPFEFSKNTSFVVHAAGIPNNRVHASDPQRVFETTVAGIGNTLEAAAKLDGLCRVVNVSSCLVSGRPAEGGALKESDAYPSAVGQLHSVYADAKRAAETLATIYRSQYRLPVSTVRPFTFAGPYQELDRPWAINNFFRDLVTKNEIRIHGRGDARRSYLYGSDAAWWTLAALVNGTDGGVYNLGSSSVVSHLQLADLICRRFGNGTRYITNTAPAISPAQDDLYPDTSHVQRSLGVSESHGIEYIVDKIVTWSAVRSG